MKKDLFMASMPRYRIYNVTQVYVSERYAEQPGWMAKPNGMVFRNDKKTSVSVEEADVLSSNINVEKASHYGDDDSL